MSGCAAKVFSDLYGKRIEPPRPCRRRAALGAIHCTYHLRSLGTVSSGEGGWCVWCLEPARRYIHGKGGASIDLCAKCSDDLVREIRRHVPLLRRPRRGKKGAGA